MGLLNETYTPELSLYGDEHDVQVFKRINDSLSNIKPNYAALEPVVGKTPKSRTFNVEEQKTIKLIAAIVLTSVNTGNPTLTGDARFLITKVARALYPELETMDFSISHHWGNLYNEVGGRIAGKYVNLWAIKIEQPRPRFYQNTIRLAPFKRNKGNKITCMRKVERLRLLGETRQHENIY